MQRYANGFSSAPVVQHHRAQHRDAGNSKQLPVAMHEAPRFQNGKIIQPGERCFRFPDALLERWNQVRGIPRTGSMNWGACTGDGEATNCDRARDRCHVQSELTQSSGLLVWPPRQLIARNTFEYAPRRNGFLVEFLQKTINESHGYPQLTERTTSRLSRRRFNRDARNSW
jgi:hypothetical protein